MKNLEKSWKIESENVKIQKSEIMKIWKSENSKICKIENLKIRTSENPKIENPKIRKFEKSENSKILGYRPGDQPNKIVKLVARSLISRISLNSSRATNLTKLLSWSPGASFSQPLLTSLIN